MTKSPEQLKSLERKALDLIMSRTIPPRSLTLDRLRELQNTQARGLVEAFTGERR